MDHCVYRLQYAAHFSAYFWISLTPFGSYLYSIQPIAKNGIGTNDRFFSFLFVPSANQFGYLPKVKDNRIRRLLTTISIRHQTYRTIRRTRNWHYIWPPGGPSRTPGGTVWPPAWAVSVPGGPTVPGRAERNRNKTGNQLYDMIFKSYLFH